MRPAIFPMGFLLLLSCRHPNRQVTNRLMADSTGMSKYFPFIGVGHRKDTIILTSMASHLAIFDEPPLQAFGPAGPAIRLYYQPAFNQWRMIRIQQHELAIDQVYRSGYWHLPINHDPKPGMLEGSTWRLEVAAHGQHHVVYGRSPDSGALYDVGRRLVQYADLKDPEIY